MNQEKTVFIDPHKLTLILIILFVLVGAGGIFYLYSFIGGGDNSASLSQAAEGDPNQLKSPGGNESANVQSPIPSPISPPPQIIPTKKPITPTIKPSPGPTSSPSSTPGPTSQPTQTPAPTPTEAPTTTPIPTPTIIVPSPT